jgi:hypothetical protein
MKLLLSQVLIKLSHASAGMCRTYLLMLHTFADLIIVWVRMNCFYVPSVFSAIYCLLKYPNRNHLLYINAQRRYVELDEGEDLVYKCGVSVDLSVLQNGFGPLVFRWLFNDVSIGTVALNDR